MTTFHVQLREFDRELSGWHAGFLRVPSAKVVRMLAKGTVVDDRCYSVDPSAQLVYWKSTEDRPKEPIVDLRVEAKLTTINVPIVVAIIGALATIGAATIGKAAWRSPSEVPSVAVCRDHLSRLRTVIDHDPSPTALKAGAMNVLDNCKQPIDAIDEKGAR